jgi:hypothetical protein
MGHSRGNATVRSTFIALWAQLLVTKDDGVLVDTLNIKESLLSLDLDIMAASVVDDPLHQIVTHDIYEIPPLWLDNRGNSFNAFPKLIISLNSELISYDSSVSRNAG